MKRKKKLDTDLNRELFDTSKYIRIYELSPIWFKLLSNLENNFLRELLEDVNYIKGIESKPVNVSRFGFGDSFWYLLDVAPTCRKAAFKPARV